MIPGAGQRFGPYEIQSRLGVGGMGYVFRAWDARLHREVALKLLQTDYAMPGMRERFLREARAASALNHPNICTIFDIGEQHGDPYLVMELLEGETVKDRILRRPLSIEEMTCIVRDVAEALSAAHVKGVVHRDIKPANIFLVAKPNGGLQAKVLDFGLAKFEGGVLGSRTSRSLDLTAQGATVGTLAYMSPEQARGETLDARSDLFSLGVVFYEMATQRIPFPGATSALVFVKLLNESPEPVREWNEAIPRELEKIIFKMLAKERAARYQTAQELIDALERFQARPSGSATGWLRKAVATVPLGRGDAGDTRERRSARRKSELPTESPAEPSRHPAESAPPTSSQQAHFLRPVARVPRGDTTPRPVASSAIPAAGSRAEAEPGRIAEQPEERPASNSSATGAQVGSSRSRGYIPEPGRIDLLAAAAPASSLAGSSRPQTSAAAGPSSRNSAPVVHSGRASEPQPGTEPPRRRELPLKQVGVALVAFIVLFAIGLLIKNRGHFGPALLKPTDSIVITDVDNRTGDRALNGSVSEALRLALAQSPYLRLRSSAAYRVVRKQFDHGVGGVSVASHAAQTLGTKAYVFGTVSGGMGHYLLHVDLLSTAGNDVMTSVEERFSSLQELPGAIDRVADGLRAAAGEGSDSITRTQSPLGREASANLEALQAFSQGEDALADAQWRSALRLYRQATALDPHFVPALLRLASVYRMEHAETAARDAAREALAASDGVGDRLRKRAQCEYEVSVSGDLSRATAILHDVLAADPADPAALDTLSEVLRQQGRMVEALSAAQRSLQAEPYDRPAYGQAQAALLGLDRFEAALQTEIQAGQLGLVSSAATLPAAFLEGQQPAIENALATVRESATSVRPQWSYGLYLDNTGQMIEGASLWRSRAAEIGAVAGLESAGAFLLAQGALDRALLGDCPGALALARKSDELPQGMVALFHSGMADALCGDTGRAASLLDKLMQTYPQSFAVTNFYVPDLRGAIALRSSDAAAALELLRPAQQYDLVSFTPYLRGLAHVAVKQEQIGIVDLQTVLAHRGAAFMVGGTVYPAAQIGVARAFAQTGDQMNSAEAYRHFLDLWRHADPRQALQLEAQAHVH